jgi:hypothetical protein
MVALSQETLKPLCKISVVKYPADSGSVVGKFLHSIHPVNRLPGN